MQIHGSSIRALGMAGGLLIPLFQAAVHPAHAQDTTVTIHAPDAQASEGFLDPGTFTVRRTGSTNFPVTVFYQLSGTASNGLDYEQLGPTVQIAAGALSASFTVRPIDDPWIEGTETVIAQIVDSPLDCATCGYQIGVPSAAEIFIADHDAGGTNHSPLVNFYLPKDGEVRSAGADIALRAYARDAEDRYDLKVEFFEGKNRLGAGIFAATTCPDPFCPYYTLVWSNVPAGRYELTAQVTDTQGASVISPVVHLFVTETNGTQPPEVNIVATDDTGSEIPVVPPWLGMAQRSDPILFTVTRSGPTNIPLTVFYSIGGTAMNGVDYIDGSTGGVEGRLPGEVTIPAGSFSAAILVVVQDDYFVEGTETVELALQAPACIALFPPPPGCYRVGPSARAIAKILDDDIVLPPVVTIVASDPHASEAGPEPGRFTISRNDSTNSALGVFYTVGGTAENGIDYLALSNLVIIPAGASSADILVAPLQDALAEETETVRVQLRAVLWPDDLDGHFFPTFPFYSSWQWPYILGVPSNAVVTIADNDLTATNHAPIVRMVAPRAGDVFTAPVDIELVAFAQDTEDHYTLKVEFFDGTTRLGLATFNPTRCANDCPNYLLTWSNVPAGEHLLTAQATDSTGTTSISGAVRIRVVESNRPPVVNIVARDPLASEGTSFWHADPDTNHWALEVWNQWQVNSGGTNTATFIVRRHGSTNGDLQVQYDIGGTAQNGADYVALSGSVTIPAGKRTAPIVVRPIDDALAERIETVLLAVRPSADYAVGFPAHAAAIIIDNDQSRPPCVLLPDHEFHLWEPATNGFCFRIAASTDLRNWFPICTNIVTEGALHFVDPDAPSATTRFYRAEPELGLPPDD